MPIGAFKPPGVYASFGPLSLSGIVLWLNAANRGSTSNRWDDISGVGNHFNAPSSGEFPSFGSGIATFDGTDDYLVGPSFAALTAGEIFCRMKINADPPATDGVTGLWAFGTGGGTGNCDQYPDTAGTLLMGYGRTARVTTGVNPTPSLATYHTLSCQSASGNFTIRYNTTQLYNTASGTVGFSATPWLGRSFRNDTVKIMLAGQIKQLVMYNRVLNSTERTAMDTYMAAIP